MRILMLATDAHGCFGGIAQFNRDVIDALVADGGVGEIVVVPRWIEDCSFSAPAKARYDPAGAGGMAAFIWRALVQAGFGGKFDLVICAHANLAFVAEVARRIARARLLVCVHGTEVWTRPRSHLARWAMKQADLILSVSKFTVERMRTWLPGPHPAAIVVPNAVRLEAFGMAGRDPDLVAHYGLEGKRVIMTLGRMAGDERAKGFDEIIALMPRLRETCPDLVYLCAGDGDDRPRLEAKARDLGCADSVVFTGRIPEARKADHYRLADAYIHPSRFEGFGIVLLEALACGIPVVGSTTDASQEALLHGELGPSADPQDPEELAEAILAAIDRPRGVPAGLAHYGVDRFRSRIAGAIGQAMAA